MLTESIIDITQDPIACSKAIKFVKELLTTTTKIEIIEEVISHSPDPTEEFNLWSEHYELSIDEKYWNL
ncbi:hypothetical protein HHI36_001156 [Cryptolaemus montrouzieri]|uniref:Uncharacterized protein n=1 Tax=Cryptolaemus montrouzieri TaxID=559131 RepID=A0ABD2P6R9_9CUCU